MQINTFSVLTVAFFGFDDEMKSSSTVHRMILDELYHSWDIDGNIDDGISWL